MVLEHALEHSRVRFSVITVCFNALNVLPDTWQSLKEQSCVDYEWVVIDGASTDGSVEWLVQRDPDVFLSEPDRGIYDAMNKAVKRARGEYLLFLNAGDRFSDNAVLTDVSAALDREESRAELLFGDVVYFGKNGLRRKRFHWLTRSKLVFGDLCHQAVFSHRDLYTRYGAFDLAYRYNADFDWFIRVFNGGTRPQYVHRDIVHFHDAGAHVLAGEACRKERDIVRMKYSGRRAWLLGHWKLRVELKLRRIFGQEVG